MTNATEHFVRQLTEHQNRLFGYIYSLIGDDSRASDVLQETNVVLWRKLDEFRSGAPFLPWAFTVARFQVLAHLRDTGRDRCLLDSELVEAVSEEVQQQARFLDETRAALRACLGNLTAENRDLVEQRYFKARSIQELSESLGRGISAIKVALLRSRRQLAACIQQRLAAEGGS